MDKKKFLNELGKLLTYMYEEDRLSALELYEDLFRDANDEDALLSLLVSPTRQAVVIARTYNAKDQRLSVESKSGKESADVSGSATPGFVIAIDKIRAEAEENGIIGFAPAEDQLTLFEPDGETEEILSEELPEGLLSEEAPISEALAEEPEALPAEPEDPFAGLDFTAHLSDDLKDLLASISLEEEVLSPAEEPVELPAEEPEVSEEIPGQESLFLDDLPAEGPEHAEAIDRYMDSFAEEEPAAAQEEAPQKPQRARRTQAAAELAKDTVIDAPKVSMPSAPRCNVPMLILYLLLGVPVTAVLILLLLLPTCASLSLSALCGYVGFKAIASAFVGFSVFADILVILGIGLVLIAAAVLFLCLFLWLLGGALPGVVLGAIRLGNRLCYKEAKA